VQSWFIVTPQEHTSPLKAFPVYTTPNPSILNMPTDTQPFRQTMVKKISDWYGLLHKHSLKY